jgi:hypothetical protein
MLVISKNYQNYTNGAVNNQLSDISREVCVCVCAEVGAQLVKGYQKGSSVNLKSLHKLAPLLDWKYRYDLAVLSDFLLLI